MWNRIKGLGTITQCSFQSSSKDDQVPDNRSEGSKREVLTYSARATHFLRMLQVEKVIKHLKDRLGVIKLSIP